MKTCHGDYLSARWWMSLSNLNSENKIKCWCQTQLSLWSHPDLHIAVLVIFSTWFKWERIILFKKRNFISLVGLINLFLFHLSTEFCAEQVLLWVKFAGCDFYLETTSTQESRSGIKSSNLQNTHFFSSYSKKTHRTFTRSAGVPMKPPANPVGEHTLKVQHVRLTAANCSCL